MFVTKIDLELEFHTDPGHGWLRVPYHFLEKFNILNKITSCSFIKGNWAYLEEDCDMPTFMLAASDHGYSLKITDIYHDEDAPCRFYPSF